MKQIRAPFLRHVITLQGPYVHTAIPLTLYFSKFAVEWLRSDIIGITFIWPAQAEEASFVSVCECEGGGDLHHRREGDNKVVCHRC